MPPTADDPTADDPTADDPTADDPTADAPTADDPAYELERRVAAYLPALDSPHSDSPPVAGLTSRLGVAYSGGVDSATLLAVAVRRLGADRVVALLGVSASLASSERTLAHRVAAGLGAEVIEVQTREQDNPHYAANGPDRCFHCKDELFSRIDESLVVELGLVAVAYGENADDALRSDRPGARPPATTGSCGRWLTPA